ncbi:MAG: hypothetical protein R2831_04025 [Chitinophagaceae bacterium]
MSKKKHRSQHAPLPQKPAQAQPKFAAKHIEEHAKSSKKQFWFLAIGIALLAVFIYSNTFQHRFVLDDHGIIKNNKITKAPISWENTKTIFSTPLRKGDFSDLENSLYRPFVKLLFNIEWNLFDANANSFVAAHHFHKVNVVLYALLCLLIFVILYDVFQKKWLLPLLITLLFTIHPIHVEVVANIKSGDEILSLLGILLCIRCLQLYNSSNKHLWIVLGALAFLMGLYSKESTVVAVAIFPLFIYFFTQLNWKKNIALSGLFLACTLLFIVSRHFALAGYPDPNPTSIMDNYLTAISGISRFSSAVTTLGFYIYTFLIPHPLSCDYSYSTLAETPVGNIKFLVSFTFFIGLLVLAIKTYKTNKALSFGILWFFITMSITSNVFFLIGTSFGERLLFAPSLGLCIIFILGLTYFFKSKKEQLSKYSEIKKYAIPLGVVIGLSILYSAKTFSRNNDWRSDFELFAKDISNYPNSTHLLFYMGNHLSGTERKEVLEDQLVQLGYTTEQVNDSSAKESAKSIYYFNRSLSIYPALPPDGYNQLGKAYFNQGQLDSAYKYYSLAHSQDTSNGIYINNMGTVFYNQGMAMLNQNPQEGTQLLLKAFPYFQTAYTKDTTESDFMNNVGCVYGTLGNPDSAIFWFQKALAKDSLDLTSIKFLAMTWKNKGNIQLEQYYNAMADRAKSIKIQNIRQ